MLHFQSNISLTNRGVVDAFAQFAHIDDTPTPTPEEEDTPTPDEDTPTPTPEEEDTPTPDEDTPTLDEEMPDDTDDDTPGFGAVVALVALVAAALLATRRRPSSGRPRLARRARRFGHLPIGPALGPTPRGSPLSDSHRPATDSAIAAPLLDVFRVHNDGKPSDEIAGGTGSHRRQRLG